MAGRVTLLGIAPAADAPRLETAMRAVPGPRLSVHRSRGLAAFAQAGRPGGGGFLRGRDRAAVLAAVRSVQRRLEVACMAAPFLPADPAAADCPAARLATLVDDASEGLAEALARDGGRHQWDVILRGAAEPVVAARRAEIAGASADGAAALAEAMAAALRAERAARAAALRAALAPHVLAIANADMAAGETETALTVLVPAGGEAAVEAALQALPAFAAADASADLRGPLPPVSFSACRMASGDPAEVARAWHMLALPAQADAELLAQHWRALAFRLHPDRQEPAAPAAPIVAAGAAYRLLREVGRAAGRGPWTLAALQRRAGPRLVPPPEPQP
jgi:hypothetical protein